MSIRTAAEKASAEIQAKLATETTEDLEEIRASINKRRARLAVVSLAVSIIARRSPRAAVRVFTVAATLSNLGGAYVIHQINKALLSRDPGGTL